MGFKNLPLDLVAWAGEPLRSSLKLYAHDYTNLLNQIQRVESHWRGVQSSASEEALRAAAAHIAEELLVGESSDSEESDEG